MCDETLLREMAGRFRLYAQETTSALYVERMLKAAQELETLVEKEVDAVAKKAIAQ